MILGLKIEYAILIVVGIVVVLLLLFLLKKRHKKPIQKTHIDEAYLEKLTLGLGGIDNIIEVSREHKRLKCVLEDAKKINTAVLQDIQASAFLKGKEVKLFVKEQIEEVIKYLESKRKNNG